MEEEVEGSAGAAAVAQYGEAVGASGVMEASGAAAMERRFGRWFELPMMRFRRWCWLRVRGKGGGSGGRSGQTILRTVDDSGICFHKKVQRRIKQ